VLPGARPAQVGARSRGGFSVVTVERRQVLIDWDWGATGIWSISTPEELAARPAGDWRSYVPPLDRHTAWRGRLSDHLIDALQAWNDDGDLFMGAALDQFVAAGHGDAMERHAEWSAALGGPLPAVGVGAEAVIDELERIVIPNGTRLSEPGFWSWITAGPGTVPVMASLAGAVASPQRYTITAFNMLEELSLDWLAELCGLHPGMKGVYSSGGSVANLIALGAARQWALEQAGTDPAADGVGSVPMALYASAEVHHTVQRAAAVLGIGRRNVRLIRTDDRQRLDPRALDQALAVDVSAGVLPVAVIATAGTTKTGAIDPLRAAGELARRYGAWFHVDGAYGLPGIVDERIEALYDGLDLADWRLSTRTNGSALRSVWQPRSSAIVRSCIGPLRRSPRPT
jgi:hypothetical protein